MRTMITLDSDVERLLKDEAHKSGQNFDVILNDVVRQAFRTKAQATARRRPFVVKARPMGLRAGLDSARLSEFADEMEIEAFLTRPSACRKRSDDPVRVEQKAFPRFASLPAHCVRLGNE